MLPELNDIKNFIEYKKIKAVATKGKGQDFIRLTLSKRDYPTQNDVSKAIGTVWKEFGESGIVPYIRR